MYELPPKRPMFEGQRGSPKERPEKMSLMTAKTFLEKNLKNLYKVKILECYHQCHQQHPKIFHNEISVSKGFFQE